MREVADRLVKKLPIQAAIAKEAAASRNLVPPEVGWERIAASSASIERWIASQLRGGFIPSGQEMTSVRKTHGTRPVPYWGPAERIIYRALTDVILGSDFSVDRSVEAYLSFVKAPVRYSQSLQRRQSEGQQPQALFFFLQSEISYVTKSDITAFYQYVDHAILAQELQVRGGDFDAISHLLELLFEVQGRSYGIPQLLDASDHLSEVYIDRVERHLLRKGIPTWRFNDDFRMACRTYSEALDSIEQLDAAARASGLVISESKTLTFGFMKYMIDSSILEPQLGQKAMNVDDVEAAVGDYTDDFSGDTDPAKAAIKSAQATGGEDASMDLRKTTVEDGRILRRAFNALIAATDPDVVEDILRLFIYVPALSPTLCKYLASVYSVAQDRVSTALDDIIGQVSMNEWQRQWVIHVIYQLKLLGSQAPGDVGSRITWVESARLESPSQVTVAIATLALAAERSIDFNTVMQEFETSPLALLNWYATALREYRDTSPDSGLDKRLEAVAKTSPLHHALVTFDAS